MADESVSINGSIYKFTQLNKDNWSVWKIRIGAALGSVGLDIHLKDSHENQPPIDAAALAAWKKAGDKALSILSMNVSDSQLPHIVKAKTAHEAYVMLKKVHEDRGSAQLIFLLNKLFQLQFQDGESMSEYITAAVSLLNQVTALAGASISWEKIVALKLLCSLPESYAPLLMTLQPTLDQISTDVVSSTLLGEAARRADYASNKDNNSGTETAFVSRSGKPFSGKQCTHCHKSGHQESSCWKKFPNLRPIRRSNASNNNTSNHSNGDNSTSSIPTAFMMKVVNTSVESNTIANAYHRTDQTTTGGPSNDWLLDSACSSHMSSRREWFHEFKTISDQPIRVGNQALLQAVGIGSITVRVSPDDGQPFLVKIHKVLYVPGIADNLLSIGAMTNSGLRLEFTGDSCILRADATGEQLGTIHKQNELYPVRATPLSMSTNSELNAMSSMVVGASSSVGIGINADLLHQRLGHLNSNSMKQLIQQKLILDYQSLPNATDIEIHQCEGCVLGKTHQTPQTHSSTNPATQLLELVHSDVCGPMSVCSKKGHSYFITFIDDYSRFVCVFIVTYKSEVMQCFVEYKTWVESRTGKLIKTLRCDNGGEYSSKEFDRFLTQHGIVKQNTAPYKPQQNGVAERFNRTLVESARAMVYHSGLSKSYWSDAVKVAAYIRNRVPNPSVTGTTPFELFYGRKPDLSHLRVFGCIAYAHIPKVKRKKLDAKAVKTIFIGYPSGVKGYLLFNTDTKKEIVSSDVTFWEDQFVIEPAIIGSRGEAESFNLIASSDLTSTDLEINGIVDNDIPVGNENKYDDQEVEDMNSDVDENEEEDPDGIADNDEAKSENPGTPILIPAVVSVPNPLNRKPDTRAERAAAERRYRESMARGESMNEFLENEAKRISSSSAHSVQRAHVVVKSEPSQTYAEAVMKSKVAVAMNTITVVQEPATYAEAMSSTHSKQWEKAAQEEYDSIQAAGTWILVPLPAGRVAIGCKWVLKLKRTAKGIIDRFKARLVAKGYSQKPGIDYNETFAPVVKFTSIRALLALAAHQNWEVHQMDVKTAFLNGDLEETIYMQQPEGFVVSGKEDMVYQLKKSIYGLKQSGRSWYQKIDTALLQMNFKRLESDHCVYVLQTSVLSMFISLYVDDLLIFSNSIDSLNAFKQKLSTLFEMKDLGEAHYVLGVQIIRDRVARTLSISQKEYIKTIANRFVMNEANSADTPIPLGNSLSKSDCPTSPTAIAAMKLKPYRSAVGAIMYAMLGTRPDITFAITALSQFNSNPGEVHWKALKRLIRYLLGTVNYSLTYGSNNQNQLSMMGYCDADWGSNQDDRRSVTGYVYILNGGAVSWQAKKQPTVALSSVEAEYMAATEATKEAIWLRSFFTEIGLKIPSPITILSDSQGSIALAKNPAVHSRSKHIDIRHHFIREQVAVGQIKMYYVPTKDMTADILTKPLSRDRHQRLVGLLGIRSLV